MAAGTPKPSGRGTLLGGTARGLISATEMVERLVAFTLITLGTAFTKSHQARGVIRPLIQEQVFRAGVRLIPMVCFLGLSLGVLIVGQTEALLQEVGANQYTGALLVTVIIRELAPLVSGLVVFARVGTASVIELGTARALGEMEALEALGIDPIHYLVVPRVIGFTVAVMGLTLYCILASLFSGYVFAYSRGLPLNPAAYLERIAAALSWVDFPLLALKSGLFGAITALIVSYQGLARPLRLEDIGDTTARTVVYCLVVCLIVDAGFIPLYLIL